MMQRLLTYTDRPAPNQWNFAFMIMISSSRGTQQKQILSRIIRNRYYTNRMKKKHNVYYFFLYASLHQANNSIIHAALRINRVIRPPICLRAHIIFKPLFCGKYTQHAFQKITFLKCTLVCGVEWRGVYTFCTPLLVIVFHYLSWTSTKF